MSLAPAPVQQKNDQVSIVKGSGSGLPTVSEGGAGTQAHHREVLPVTSVPIWTLGNIAPDSIVLPVRLPPWTYKWNDIGEIADRTKGGHKIALPIHEHTGLVALSAHFGFAYWRSLSIEIVAHPCAPWIRTNLAGAWTYQREPGAMSTSLIRCLPNCAIYNLAPGDSVVIECAFGGLTSPLLFSNPLIGARPAFYAQAHSVNVHPAVYSESDGANVVVPDVKADLPVVELRIVGELVAHCPLPGLFATPK